MKREYVVLGGALAAWMLYPITVTAQSYPERPVRVIVGLAPGGGTDTVTRLLTTRLADQLGQSFIVDNRPSSGGNLAGELTARAAPDGHTLLTITPTHVVNPYLYKDIRFDALKDFSAISSIVFTHYVLSVRNTVPANSVKELIALTKTQKLNYASTGIGSANHLSGELFKTMAGIDMSHVPYKGGGPALNAMLAGEIQVMFTAMAGVIPHVKAGRVRALAVTGTKRALAAPDVPTLAEAGVPGYDVTGWYGLAGPAKISKAVVDKLNQATVKAIADLKDRYLNIGLEASPSTPAEFSAFLKSESEKWGRVVKISGAKVDG